jgi:pilus assembly protein Flp/PilA
MFKCKSAAILRTARHLMRDDGAATAIEYALIASGIAVAISATIFSLGTSVNGLYSSVASAMK